MPTLSCDTSDDLDMLSRLELLREQREAELIAQCEVVTALRRVWEKEKDARRKDLYYRAYAAQKKVLFIGDLQHREIVSLIDKHCKENDL